jgi:hypothetical protein
MIQNLIAYQGWVTDEPSNVLKDMEDRSGQTQHTWRTSFVGKCIMREAVFPSDPNIVANIGSGISVYERMSLNPGYNPPLYELYMVKYEELSHTADLGFMSEFFGIQTDPEFMIDDLEDIGRYLFGKGLMYCDIDEQVVNARTGSALLQVAQVTFDGKAPVWTIRVTSDKISGIECAIEEHEGIKELIKEYRMLRMSYGRAARFFGRPKLL